MMVAPVLNEGIIVSPDHPLYASLRSYEAAALMLSFYDVVQTAGDYLAFRQALRSRMEEYEVAALPWKQFEEALDRYLPPSTDILDTRLSSLTLKQRLTAIENALGYLSDDSRAQCSHARSGLTRILKKMGDGLRLSAFDRHSTLGPTLQYLGRITIR